MAAVGVTTDADLACWRRLGDDPRVSDATFQLRLREREAVGSNYRQRLRELLAIVDDRRRERPLPSLSDVSAAELAQHRILLDKMHACVWSGQAGDFLRSGRPTAVPIVTTSRIGIAAAEEVFGATPAVILERGEWETWQSARPPFDGYDPAGSWCVRRWWYLGEELPGWAGRKADHFRRTHALPAGHKLWLVIVCARSPGEMVESSSVFSWDGERATYLDSLGDTWAQVLETPEGT